MSLKDKAAKIGFSDLDAPSPPLSPSAPPAPPMRARSGVAAITQSIGMHHRVQDLEVMVAEYEKGGVVVVLDPGKIAASPWKNRHESSYHTQSFEQLKGEIEASAGNVQPIKVRRLGQGSVREGLEYELVYGRRRHRACLELGIPVRAIVQELSDKELFQEMERENRMRADLSPWEQGSMYKDALDQGLFASQRQLAAALGIDQSNLSKAIRIASLPSEVIEAFPSPIEIQFRWGVEIAEVFEKNPESVLRSAQRIREMQAKPPAKDVHAALLNLAAPPKAEMRQFRANGKVVAELKGTGKGGATLRVKDGALSTARHKKLVEFLDKLFE